MIQGILLAFNMQPTNLFKHLISSDRISIKKGTGIIKGTGYFFCKEEDCLCSWTVHAEKVACPLFLNLFSNRKKDDYKHVDLVQDLP
jgi:hypothetical protein